MNETAMIDFATASEAPAHTMALSDLAAGEARDSLLGAHEVLRRELPQGRRAIYEAGRAGIAWHAW
jgi:hypothetical protein